MNQAHFSYFLRFADSYAPANGRLLSEAVSVPDDHLSECAVADLLRARCLAEGLDPSELVRVSVRRHKTYEAACRYARDAVASRPSRGKTLADAIAEWKEIDCE